MGISGSSSVVIDAPAAACAAAAADFERAHEWQQSIKGSTVLERDSRQRPTLVEGEFDALIRSVRLRLAITYEPDGNTVRRLSGDLKAMEATWTFEALTKAQTRATYTIALDPGRMLGMLIKGPAAGQLHKLLIEQPPQGLKAHVEVGRYQW